LRELPSLLTLWAILLGWAAPAPIFAGVKGIPEKFRPHSPDSTFWDGWIGEQSRGIDWVGIARTW